MVVSFRELRAFNHFNRIEVGRLVVVDECWPNKLKNSNNDDEQIERNNARDGAENIVTVIGVVVVAVHQLDKGEPLKVSLNVHEMHEKNQC